jgi:hypothetical protein
MLIFSRLPLWRLNSCMRTPQSLFNNYLRKSPIHPLHSAFQPILCFSPKIACIDCYKTKIMAAPTFILLACCFFIGGLYHMKDPAGAVKQRPCVISRVPILKASNKPSKIQTKLYIFQRSSVRTYSGPSTRTLPEQVLGEMASQGIIFQGHKYVQISC